MANHPVVITSTVAAASGAVTEQAGVAGSVALDAASGIITFTDVDLTDTHTVSAVAQGTGYLGSFGLGRRLWILFCGRRCGFALACLRLRRGRGCRRLGRLSFGLGRGRRGHVRSPGRTVAASNRTTWPLEPGPRDCPSDMAGNDGGA